MFVIEMHVDKNIRIVEKRGGVGHVNCIGHDF
jgi:hypothetical protein